MQLLEVECSMEAEFVLHNRKNSDIMPLDRWDQFAQWPTATSNMRPSVHAYLGPLNIRYALPNHIETLVLKSNQCAQTPVGGRMAVDSLLQPYEATWCYSIQCSNAVYPPIACAAEPQLSSRTCPTLRQPLLVWRPSPRFFRAVSPIQPPLNAPMRPQFCRPHAALCLRPHVGESATSKQRPEI